MIYPAAKVFADDVSLYTLDAPALEYKSFRVDEETGPVNTKLDRGEVADLDLVLRNAGSAVGGLSGTLVSRNPHITVVDGAGMFAPAGVGETTSSSMDGFRVEASASAPIEMPLYCDLFLSGPGYVDTISVPLIVGDSMNLPDGPDAYGFAIWDHTDSVYAQRPVFDWFEINGVGEALPLGADDIVNIELPSGFGTWRYYGQDYDSLGVASNGFITAGASDRVDFVNIMLPYSRAPGNIVAVVWDDLHPPDGGSIWYYHDAAHHRIIVEYDSVPYFGVGGGERVQVHVYDRTVPTPTGDNRIEIHFETVNYFSEATVGMQNSDGSTGLTHHWNGWRPRTAAPLVEGQALRFETAELVGVAERPGSTPLTLDLSVVPTVFLDRVFISLAGSYAGRCRTATIHAVDGRTVRTLRSGKIGMPRWIWDGRDDEGERLAPGTYFVRFESAVGTGKVVLVRPRDGRFD